METPGTKDKLLRHPLSQADWNKIVENQKNLIPIEYQSSAPSVPCTIQCTDNQEHNNRG
jgi:hypothetical protein